MVDVGKLIEEVRIFPVLYDQSSEKYRNFEYKEKVWKQIATNLKVEGGVEECKKKWSSVRDQLRRTLQKRKRKCGQTGFKYHKYKYEDILTFLLPYLEELEGIPNVPKPQVDEGDGENESVEVKREDFTDDSSHRLILYDEPVAEEEYLPGADARELSFRPATPSSVSGDIESNRSSARPKANKRKIPRFEDTPPRYSPSSRFTAYAIPENKVVRTDAVDAFLAGIAPTLKSLTPRLLHKAKGKIFAVVQEIELKQLGINEISQGHFMSKNVTLPFSESSSSSSSAGA